MSTPLLEDAFSYEYGVDVNTGTAELPVWTPFKAPTGIDPQVTPVTTDRSSYDDLGSPNESKISESWTLGFSALAFRDETGAYQPEIEKLMTLTGPDVKGSAAVGHFRWYDKPSEGIPNENDAFEGFATVTLNRGSTDNASGGSWAITLAGKGRRKQIVNPFDGWPVVVP